MRCVYAGTVYNSDTWKIIQWWPENSGMGSRLLNSSLDFK